MPRLFADYTVSMNDPFQTLQLSRSFEIDAQQLETNFIQLSAATHPDRFSDPIEQAEASERAAEINEAYQVLRDPQRRAEALLELIMAGHGQSAKKSEEMPPDFLMQMMETRERMETALEQDDQETLDELRRWARQEHQQHLERIETLFHDHLNSVSTDAAPDSLVGQVRKELNVLRYIDRMLEQL